MTMETIKNPDKSEWKEIFSRPKLEQTSLKSTVKEVFEEVRKKGDDALINYSEKFDGVSLTDLILDKNQLKELAKNTAHELKEAIEVAYKNIYKFHEAQLQKSEKIETTTGVFCWRKSIGIDTVGLYIPGGSAPLFSTLLMLAIPAKIAGCQKLIVCTPPQKGELIIHPAIAFTALLCGIGNIATVGGAQAIAAMALGTHSIEKCYKIFGPGNQYVTAAKEYAQEFHTAIDMPAGPSEVMVVADDSGNPEFIAADLLSQAEHGPDSQVILISDSEKMIQEVKQALEQQLEQLPRKEIAKKALGFSKLIYAEKADFIEMINTYAPEHLILQIENVENTIEKIRNAGSVFVGNYTPESVGDYASGTNHTLPTDGYAHMYSGVSVDSFVKKITFQEITEEGLNKLGPIVSTMAKHEALDAHKNAVELRLNETQSKNNSK